MRALIPLFFFVVVYLGYSIAAGDFYKIPITVAFMLTAIVGVLVSKGSIKHRIKVFSRGAASDNLMLMVWISVVAVALDKKAREMGSVHDTPHLTPDAPAARRTSCQHTIGGSVPCLRSHLAVHRHECRHHRGADAYRCRHSAVAR